MTKLKNGKIYEITMALSAISADGYKYKGTVIATMAKNFAAIQPQFNVIEETRKKLLTKWMPPGDTELTGVPLDAFRTEWIEVLEMEGEAELTPIPAADLGDNQYDTKVISALIGTVIV